MMITKVGKCPIVVDKAVTYYTNTRLLFESSSPKISVQRIGVLRFSARR
jgi:hypothetical protein